MTPTEAMALLRQSRDAEHNAPIWHDDGQTVTQLAQLAGTTVTYATVDLTEMETIYTTVNTKETARA